MSLVILGDIRIKPEGRDALIAAGAKMMAASNAEDGCHRYNFAFDVAEPDLVRISEEWESEEALAAHFATPHMAEFQAALRGVVAGPAAVNKYGVASQGPMR